MFCTSANCSYCGEKEKGCLLWQLITLLDSETTEYYILSRKSPFEHPRLLRTVNFSLKGPFSIFQFPEAKFDIHQHYLM